MASGWATTGARSRSATTEPRLQPAEDVEGPAQARVQGQGCAQRQPAHVQLGRRPASSRRRWGTAASASNVAAGHRLLRAAEEERQLHPGADDPADGRVGPDADLDRLGLHQLRLHQGLPRRRSGASRSRRTGSTAATTPRPSMRPLRIRRQLVSGRSSSTPTRVRSSGSRVRAPGAVQRPRRAQGHPGGAAEGASGGRRSTRRSSSRASASRRRPRSSSRQQWPTKVGA